MTASGSSPRRSGATSSTADHEQVGALGHRPVVRFAPPGGSGWRTVCGRLTESGPLDELERLLTQVGCPGAEALDFETEASPPVPFVQSSEKHTKLCSSYASRA